MGVVSSRCTTKCVRIRASTISRRTSLWREQQDQRPHEATTLRYMGPPRPGPLLNRPVGDKCSQRGKPSQANRGPKNLGRSKVRRFAKRAKDAAQARRLLALAAVLDGVSREEAARSAGWI